MNAQAAKNMNCLRQKIIFKILNLIRSEVELEETVVRLL